MTASLNIGSTFLNWIFILDQDQDQVLYDHSHDQSLCKSISKNSNS